MGWAEEQGNRPSMEDRCLAKPVFCPNNIAGKVASTRAICGVFDGHSGSQTAEYASERLPAILERASWFKSAAPLEVEAVKASLETAFVDLDDEILAKAVERTIAGGSTANVVLVADDWLYCANLGDARAVLSRGGSAISLSTDHKPNVEAEKQRIEAANGKVEWRGCWRVLTNGGVNARGLAVSRAFGDLDWKVSVLSRSHARTLCFGLSACRILAAFGAARDPAP